MNRGPLRMFALSESRVLGDDIARAMGSVLAEVEETGFEDGEHKAYPAESVRGCDVFVVQSLYDEPGKSVNDKLCRLWFFIGALKDASAACVTAVVPYLAYARADRKTRPREPVTLRYVAQLFEAAGTDRVITLDVHDLAGFQNAFRCRTDHLEAGPLLVDHFAGRLQGEVVVVSPDVGGLKRAERFRRKLARRLGTGVGSALMEKYRSDEAVSGAAVVGNVCGKTVLIVDDLISTGGTVARAAHACREQGAIAVHAAVTHGLFVGEAAKVVADPALDSLAITDSVPPFRLSRETIQDKLTLIPIAPLFAEAIRQIRSNGSVSRLMGD
ncbi:ribose-phosphate pyrophosphokinase [Methylocaldum marinum]|uniref:ribose-phosphate diphosphokinase n=1 Tax=Methylocaldum marinum TaxID=1432792 RepID=A0A250KUV0_9GAMM|nr:ribose-phosphate pyrophosphokinase [Methylocaldum marinum]BBA35362.1 ribose-phosphate pyrophosphokinase [Methylocaldum marinum]